MDPPNIFAPVIKRLQTGVTYDETHSIFKDACEALEKTFKTDLPEHVVNEGVQLIIATSALDGLSISDILQLWKIYLHFLKQHQDKINAQLAEKVVATIHTCIFQGLEISFLDKIQQITDSTVSARKLQVLLFFCQRLFTTIVYLSANLSNDTITHSYGQLLLCRGLCFALGRNFANDSNVSSKLGKFDTLFSNCLEPQPSQLHRLGELQRRQQLFLATAQSLCLAPREGVQHRFMVLGVLSYSSCALRADKLLPPLLPPAASPGASPPCDLLAALRSGVQGVLLAAECLNTCFCGEVADEV
jgi:hypothetical protein